MIERAGKLREERFIIKVVEMHYKQGLSQQEIGKKLNVSRTTISRALAQAKKQGYVQIKINYPEDSAINLEGRLEERFGLKEAVIASSLNENDLKEEIAFFASDYLLRTLKNHMTIALTRGVTLQNMVEFLGKDVRLKFLKTDDVNVVPLMAATNISVSMDKGYRMAYSNYLIEEVAKIINGNSYQMLAPQYVTSPEAKKVFMEEKSIKEVFDLAKSADIAVAGIGTLDHNSALTNAEFIPMEEFEQWYGQQSVYRKAEKMPTLEEMESEYIELQEAAALLEIPKAELNRMIAAGAYKDIFEVRTFDDKKWISQKSFQRFLQERLWQNACHGFLSPLKPQMKPRLISGTVWNAAQMRLKKRPVCVCCAQSWNK